MNKITIDATSGTLGRIASFAAKQALLGKDITIVNCNSALISGRKTSTIREYKQSRARRSSSLKGPHFPSIPEKLMRRTIRGMLPRQYARGTEALKKIRCYNTVPAEFEKVEKLSLKRDLKVKSISLKELHEKL